MRFQVYTSLAYGARGLAYFKYFTPAVGNYRNGPIDPFGHEWLIGHSIEEVTPDEMQRRYDKLFTA